MKKFEAPFLRVQVLETETFLTASGCWESFDCKKCYADAAICDGTFTCTGLVCPCLGTLNI